MKITMYELLGLVKDGKAPKKILYNNYRVYELDEYNHYMYKDIDNTYIDLYDETFNCELDEFLNDKVEIIEYKEEKEEKKIPEKLSTWFSVETKQSKELNIEYANTNFENMYEKINSIIDYLKSKGE